MSANATESNHTEHALLVLLGQYAQHLSLIPALMNVPLHQKTHTHRLQTKIPEFLVVVLAGLPHLESSVQRTFVQQAVVHISIAA